MRFPHWIEGPFDLTETMLELPYTTLNGVKLEAVSDQVYEKLIVRSVLVDASRNLFATYFGYKEMPPADEFVPVAGC